MIYLMSRPRFVFKKTKNTFYKKLGLPGFFMLQKKIDCRFAFMKKVLVIDNYDSFTHNLVHYLENLDCSVRVRRNDQLTLEEVDEYQDILLSPGPGLPEEAGLLKSIIKNYAPKKNILGICLGQQAIAEVFGGQLHHLKTVFHGVESTVSPLVADEFLFKNLPSIFSVGRYHSWVVHPDLPSCLEATSVDENQQIMSLRHRIFNLRAVQFHPESILTPHGHQMIKNWIDN